MHVETIMTEPVHCVMPEIALAELRGIFKRVRYHHLLVALDNHLLGVISDRDVLRMSSPYLDTADATAHDQTLLETKAQNIMSTTLITAKKDTLIDAAAILLLEHNISCLPVVSKDGDIEGILTWKDMLKYYVYVR
jgi:acetoin utilization protein AcuB